MILPLAGNTYLEIVEVLDHPASDKAPFGQAVRARSALGGAGWAGSSPSMTSPSSSSGSAARRRAWQPPPPRRQRAGLEADRRQRADRRPAAAVLHRWESPPRCTRAGADPEFSLACLEIAGDPHQVSEWLGETVEAPLEDVKVEVGRPNGTRASSPSGSDPERARPPVKEQARAKRVPSEPGKPHDRGTRS